MLKTYSRSSLRGGVSFLVLALTISTAAQAGALPFHGRYVTGEGEFNKAGASLTVKQSSTTGIINWSGFSIGSKNAVTFKNGSGATLNRVIGGNLSTIAGSLHATGSLYLINSQGVIVSDTGHVLTGGGFVASSGNISNNAFDADQRHLSIATARVVNRGSIVSGGEVKIVGDRVVNSGTVIAAIVKLRADDGEARDSGVIHATGGAHNSARILVVSESGKAKITGHLIARNADGSGGSIETSGRTVSIGGDINAGRGGSWLVDPHNLTVTSSAAKTIDATLHQGTNVTLKTTKSGTSGPGTASSGPGDIVIDSALSWNTTAMLTLDAYHSVLIDAPMSLDSTAKLTLQSDDGGSDGILAFSSNGDVAFGNLAGVLTINSSKYTLVNSLSALDGDITHNPSGHYALATSYNAKADGTYLSPPISSPFTGKFEGLGNTINNLKIDSSEAGVGLFAEIGVGGRVADLRVSNASVTSTYSGLNGAIGILAATNEGTIRGVAVSGGSITATGTDDGANNVVESLNVGGLVGVNDAIILDSHSSADVRANNAEGADVSSLVGDNTVNGSIADSYASGAATGKALLAQVGDLVAVDFGTITSSHASGAVTGGDQGNYGGLVGDVIGSVSDSYATGNVTSGGNGALTGGFVGENDGAIATSYAKGKVVGGNAGAGFGLGIGGLVGYNDGSITTSYATGSATGGSASGTGAQIWIGGLVGLNIVAAQGTGIISESYATGAVKGGTNADVGGFSGVNNPGATITQAYSTGTVTAGSGSLIGGFTGFDDGGITTSYWDTTTSGITKSHGAGNVTNDAGITAKTTTQLEAGLPSGFSTSVWAESAAINGGLPYLKALASSY
jgi:filamentous hemagglutinin family protein